MARPIAEDFGRAFRRAYEAAGLTQVDLADRLQQRGWAKVTQSQISKWVRGVSVPPLDILPDVDAACGKPRGYVLRHAGYVEDANDVLTALVVDPVLDDEDKSALRLLYRVLTSKTSARTGVA